LFKLGVSRVLDEFLVGQTHEKNFVSMIENFEQERPNLQENDFLSKFGIQAQKNFLDFSQRDVEIEDLKYPLFSSYRMTSLD
jgi:hypothetical protein